MKIIAMILSAGEERGKIVQLEDELHTYQDIVGGNIETVTLREDLVMIVNDTGLIERLPENGLASMFYWWKCGGIVTPICGNAVLIGVDAAGEGKDIPIDAVMLCDHFEQALYGGPLCEGGDNDD